MTADLIGRARSGDADAFGELTEPHLRELQVHCYRMLGSFADAEDALLAAWQGLSALRSASRRPAKEWDVPKVDPPEPTRLGEVVWLEPFPTPSWRVRPARR